MIIIYMRYIYIRYTLIRRKTEPGESVYMRSCCSPLDRVEEAQSDAWLPWPWATSHQVRGVGRCTGQVVMKDDSPLLAEPLTIINHW